MLKKIKKSKFLIKGKRFLNRRNPTLLGHIDHWDGREITGWYLNLNIEDPVKLSFDDKFQTNIYQNIIREDLEIVGISKDSKAGFSYPLDINDVRSKAIDRISVANNRMDLIGSPLLVKKLKSKGHIDKIDSFSLVGWIFDESYPEANLKLDLYINGKKVETFIANKHRDDLIAAGYSIKNCGFDLDISNYISLNKINTIDIKFYNTDKKAFPKQVLQTNFAKTNALVKLQNIIKKQLSETYDQDLLWLNHDVFPELIDKIRGNNLNLPNSNFRKKNKQYTKVVDIIIPVYKGVKETIDCIESVFGVKCNSEFNVIVINDSSPQTELTKALKDLANKLPFQLLENKENLGFVKTVNIGMKISETNDVLLLNSDTIVTDHWLDRILETAYSEPTIGTVTPFSNNATICSYPKFCVDNQLPKNVSLAELADVVSNNNGVIDLPTAHGFSMFIKRQTLDEVGLFDEKKWGKGYAEENDFSLRAEKLGWRNVMATNAFVVHMGSVSFADDALDFMAKNLEKLNVIYPDYVSSVQEFIKNDPVRLYRNNIAISLMMREVEEQSNLVRNYQGSFVFVSLTLGGGTEVATNDLSALHLKNNQCVFMLVCPKPGIWELRSQVDNSVAQFCLPSDRQYLLNVLRKLKVFKFHFHHTLQFDKSIWDLPSELGVNYDVTLHDYYTICPRINLIDETEFYCGEPSSEACNRCIRRNGVHNSSYLELKDLGGNIENWRAFFEGNLRRAERVITPSFDTKNRILKYFNLDNVNVIYHPEEPIEYLPPKLNDIEVINVAFIGAIGIHKGLKILKNCAEYSYKFNLPIKFIVIGYTSDDKYFDNLPNVEITGSYKVSDIDYLINKYDCHIASLFSVWPETYSYTLSEAMRNNLKVIAFNIGAIPERNSFAKLISLDSSTKEIVETLLSEK